MVVCCSDHDSLIPVPYKRSCLGLNEENAILLNIKTSFAWLFLSTCQRHCPHNCTTLRILRVVNRSHSEISRKECGDCNPISKIRKIRESAVFRQYLQKTKNSISKVHIRVEKTGSTATRSCEVDGPRSPNPTSLCCSLV